MASELFDGAPVVKRRRLMAYVGERLEGFARIDDATVNLPPFGCCRFSAYAHAKGAMISSSKRADQTFGSMPWHSLDALMLVRDTFDGGCIVYICPIEALFESRTIGHHGVRWADVERLATFRKTLAPGDPTLATRDAPDFLEIVWRNADARGYRDQIPAWVWLDGGQTGPLEHPVRDAHGGLHRARCSVSLPPGAPDSIDLKYRDDEPPNSVWGCYAGVTRLVIGPSGHPERVLWIAPGGEPEDLVPLLRFERQRSAEAEAIRLASDLLDIETGKHKPTQRPALIDARLGQGQFRAALDKRWRESCALTGLTVRAALRASHIRAWKDSTDDQRLDANNGLLLAAHVDALFDRHLLSFERDGKVVWSDLVPECERERLKLPRELRNELRPEEWIYLKDHRGTLK